MNDDAQTTDVCVVGAGPIGIEIAIALKRAAIPYRHLEAGCLGATMEWWAPETVFFSSSDRISIAGVPLHNQRQSKTSREEYLTYLRSVVEQFGLTVSLYTRVVGISRSNDLWKLSLETSTHGVGGRRELERLPGTSLAPIFAKNVVFAIGDMHAPQLLSIPGEDLPHVSHYLEEPHRYFGRTVVIVGGKNSAVEAAIRLVRCGARVTLCHRGAALDKARIKFWLLPEIESLIRRTCITFLPNTTLRSIDTNGVTLESDGRSSRIAAEDVLLLTGYRQDASLYEQAGITLEGEGKRPQHSRSTMETNQKGLYVAGTGSAGTQLGGVTEFIETSHVHVARILAHLQGNPPPEEDSLREVEQREM